MGTFLVFIMKSTCCLAVFYLFYRLLLSRDTFHRFNRMALLGVIAFSMAVPFMRFATDEPAIVQPTVSDIGRLLQMAGTPVEVESGLSFWLVALFVVYASGCLFFTGRFLYSVWLIVHLIRSGEMTMLEDGTRLVVTDRTIPPFSWMKYIVISRIDMEESGAEILAHEHAHIRAYHSLDMWLAGCCVVLHWFNPAAWLLKQELQNVHEYEADECVIAHGVDAKHYQLLLIKKAVGVQRFTSMANNFNHSKLKKRIAMMLKQKSNPWARLKYLYVLPLATVAVVAFARPEVSVRLDEISEINLSDFYSRSQSEVEEEVIRQPDTIPSQQRTEEQEKPLYVLDGMEMPDLDLKQLDPALIGSITVLKEEGATSVYGKKGKHGVLLITTKRRDKLLDKPRDTAGNRLFLPLPGTDIKLRPAPRIGGLAPTLDPVVIVDGKEMPYSEFEKIETERIRSMNILNQELALRKYGKKFKDRSVMEIELKRKDI